MRIFIHHNGALGDLLLSIRAIETLRASGDVVHLSGRRDIVDFLLRIGYIHESSDSDSSLFLPLFTGVEDGELLNFLDGFDKAYVFTVNRSSEFVKNMHSAAGNLGIIHTIPPPGTKMHVSEYRLQQLLPQNDFAVTGCSPLSSLTIASIYREKAVEMLENAGYDFRRPLTAIHPGSGGRLKCWPFDHYKALAEKLREAGDHFLLLLSGPAEEGDLKEGIEYLAAAMGKDSLLASGLELVIVASLLSLCDYYIGNDSGITHLASLLTRKGIALFGPTDPVLWGPIHDGYAVIRTKHECAPCENTLSGNDLVKYHGDCHIRCLSDISVQMVYDAVGLNLSS